MSGKLSGKVALVTGASRGIGAAIARRLASEGAVVAITNAKAPKKAEEVMNAIKTEGGKAHAIQADNADAEALKRAVGETVKTLNLTRRGTKTAGEPRLLRIYRLLEMSRQLQGPFWVFRGVGALFVRFILGLILQMGSVSSNAQEPDLRPDLATIQQKLSHAYSYDTRIQFSSSAKVFYEGKDGQRPSDPNNTGHVQFSRNGDNVSLLSQIDTLSNGAKNTQTSRFVINDGQYFVDDRASVEPNTVQSAYARPASDGANVLVGDKYAGNFLEGRVFLLGDQNWGTLLNSTSSLEVAPQQEAIDGAMCWRVDANSEQGRYTMWVDPHQGYLVRHASATLKSDNVIDGKKIGSLGAPTSSPGIMAHYSVVEIEVRNIKIGNVNGLFVPLSGECSIKNILDNGESTQTEYAVERSDLSLNPVDQSSPRISVDWPTGTRASGLGALSGMNFIWRGDHLVPYIDQAQVAELLGIEGQLKSDATANPGRIPPRPTQSTTPAPPGGSTTAQDYGLLERLRAGLTSPWFLAGVVLLISASAIGWRLLRRRQQNLRAH